MSAAAPPTPAQDAVERGLAAWRAGRPKVHVLVTANDMNFEHGSGILMTRIMEEAPHFVSMRAFDDWGGTQTIKPVRAFRYGRYATDRDEIGAYATARLDYFDIEQIVSVPFTREDVAMALAAKDLAGAPLTVYVMDDNAIFNDGIPRAMFDELVRRADRRFVISETMRTAYTAAFGLDFHLLPPTVHARLIRPAPSAVPERRSDGRLRAVMVGNVWHDGWLRRMLDAIAGLPLDIGWHIGTGDPHWLTLDEDALAEAGVRIIRGSPPEAIGADTEAASLVLVPSTDGRETDGHAAAIGRMSLPSKIPFIMATAGTPILVLHEAQSGAADFVAHAGIGLNCGYRRADIENALCRLRDPAAQSEMRRRAFDLGSRFGSGGVYAMMIDPEADPTRFDAVMRHA